MKRERWEKGERKREGWGRGEERKRGEERRDGRRGRGRARRRGVITSSNDELETPLGKRRHAPERKFLPTPVERKLHTEDPVRATAFVGDTSHIQKFVDQINCTSKCSCVMNRTNNC